MRTAVLGVRRSIIREGLGVELLLFHIVRSQLRWLSYLTRTPLGHHVRGIYYWEMAPE